MEGVLTRIFGNPMAKILDQVYIVGNMEQTIDMVMESTGLGRLVVKYYLDKLADLEYVEKTPQGYKFDPKLILDHLRNGTWH